MNARVDQPLAPSWPASTTLSSRSSTLLSLAWPPRVVQTSFRVGVVTNHCSNPARQLIMRQDLLFFSPTGLQSKLASACWRPIFHTYPSDLRMRSHKLYHVPCAFLSTLCVTRPQQYHYILHCTRREAGIEERTSTERQSKVPRVVRLCNRI